MVGDFGSGSNTTVTLGNTNHSGTFSGTITNGQNDILSLVKNGSGTQVLSGANSDSGATTVNGGTLRIAGSTYTGTRYNTSTVGTITINNGGTLQVTGAGQLYANLYTDLSGAITVNSGGDLVLNSWVFGDSLAHCTSTRQIFSSMAEP